MYGCTLVSKCSYLNRNVLLWVNTGLIQGKKKITGISSCQRVGEERNGFWHAVNTRVSVLHRIQTPQQHVTSELQHGACVYRELSTSSRGRAAHLRSRCRSGAPEAAAAARSHARTPAPEGRRAPRTARWSVRTPCGRGAGQTPPAFSAARQPLRPFPVEGRFKVTSSSALRQPQFYPHQRVGGRIASSGCDLRFLQRRVWGLSAACSLRLMVNLSGPLPEATPPSIYSSK